MWSLCHHVVTFIVIQRDLIKWIVIFAIMPATLAATNLPVVLDTETSTSVYVSFPFKVLTDRNLNWVYQNVEKSFIQKRESHFKGCDPTALFITDAASYHRRSCQAALWLLPHLQLRRVLICLDVVYQAHTHEAGVSVCCSYPSDIRPPRTASLPIHSIH